MSLCLQPKISHVKAEESARNQNLLKKREENYGKGMKILTKLYLFFLNFPHCSSLKYFQKF